MKALLGKVLLERNDAKYKIMLMMDEIQLKVWEMDKCLERIEIVILHGKGLAPPYNGVDLNQLNFPPPLEFPNV